ncbi:MAG: methyltransferase domain-containing protein [Pseudomonadota bacterium]
MPHVFDPAHASRLHSVERQKIMPVSRLLDNLAPLDGQTWIDLGAGTGYYTRPLARVVATVHAVDAQAGMLEQLKGQLVAGERPHIVLHQVRAEDHDAPAASADGVLIGNCFHELDDRAAVLQRCHTWLRPGGRLVVVDWLHADDASGPLPEQGPPAEHRLPLATVRADLERAGFSPEVHLDWFVANYVIVARAR